MTLKSYLWGMRLATLISVVAFVLIVIYVDPETTGAAGKILFYFILFFSLVGFLNLVLLKLRKRIINKETISKNMRLSFRQAVLLSVFFIGLLIMQSFQVLIWWDALLLFVGIFLAELYFLSKS